MRAQGASPIVERLRAREWRPAASLTLTLSQVCACVSLGTVLQAECPRTILLLERSVVLLILIVMLRSGGRVNCFSLLSLLGASRLVGGRTTRLNRGALAVVVVVVVMTMVSVE